MADSLTLMIEQSRRYLATDAIQLEVDGAAQGDKARLWDGRRARLGFGHGLFGAASFGKGSSLGFGRGAFGRGVFGQGAALVEVAARGTFVADDYPVRGRAYDDRPSAGNVGAWGPSIDHPHRPLPPAPAALAITTGTLAWAWADP